MALICTAMANFTWSLLDGALSDVFKGTDKNLSYWINSPGLVGSPVYLTGLLRLSQVYRLSCACLRPCLVLRRVGVLPLYYVRIAAGVQKIGHWTGLDWNGFNSNEDTFEPKKKHTNTIKNQDFRLKSIDSYNCYN